MTEWKPLELFFKVTGLQGISYSVSLTFLPERKKQRNPPGLEQSLGRGFWSRIPAPFPRQFCISRTSVISIPSNVFFPNTATLAKSRFPSSDQIPYPVNKFCVFPNHRRTVFRLYRVPPDSENTPFPSRPSLRASESIHAKAKSSYVNIKTTWSYITTQLHYTTWSYITVYQLLQILQQEISTARS